MTAAMNEIKVLTKLLVTAEMAAIGMTMMTVSRSRLCSSAGIAVVGYRPACLSR